MLCYYSLINIFIANIWCNTARDPRTLINSVNFSTILYHFDYKLFKELGAASSTKLIMGECAKTMQKKWLNDSLYTIQDCDKVYVGETGRTFNVHQKEHKRHLFNGNIEDSAVAAHAHQESHYINWENTFVIDYDDDFSRGKSKNYY